jgi:PKD repeat protein
MKSILTLLMVCVSVFAFSATQRYRLMFNDDPATTITIGWEQVSGSNPTVYYGTSDGGLNSANYSNSITPYKTTNYMGMTSQFAKITGLTPNTAYYFIIEDSEGISQPMVYWFRTCPDNNNEKLSIISGGDSRSGQTQRQNSNAMVAKIRPHAVLFGGDLVNFPENGSVQTWLDDWEFATTTDGQMFPLVHSYGNHENYLFGGPEFISELFDTNYDCFYNVRFGGDLFSVYTLNGELLPGHEVENSTKRVAQRDWLLAELPNDTSIWKGAQYHRPMVPHESGKGEGADEFNDWANAFYDYDVRIVMESDAHVTKVTKQVRPAMTVASGSSSNWFTDAGIPDGKGISFIGEGAWGTIRNPDDIHPFSLAWTEMYQFNWLIIDRCKVEIRTIDTQSPGTVPEHAPGDLFSISPGLDAQIWKPSSIPTGLTTVYRYDNLPEVDFSAVPANAFEGQTIDFSDLSSASPTSWNWNFGDGASSTVQNPNHSYASAGTYTVTLEASNAAGTCSAKKTDYITVFVPSAPVAEFVADDVTPIVTQPVNFTDLSTGNPTSWSWDFGDGGASTQQNPVHQYAQGGTYTVTLTATNQYGTDNEIKTAYITVNDGGSVFAQVTGTNNDAEESTDNNPGEMYLNSTDLEIGNDFGDEQIVGIRFVDINVPQSADITNARVRFMCDEADLSSSQLNIYFAAHDIDDAPIFSSANNDISSRTLTTAQVVWPDGSVPGWDVGNIYDSPDLSAVIQELVDRPGWQSGNSIAIMVWSDPGESSERVAEAFDGTYGPVLEFDWGVPASPDAPVAAFAASETTICLGETISFDDNSTNIPTSWGWDFGDGGFSTQQNPFHTYTSPGTYTVSLTASNSGGADNETIQITVNPIPVVDAGADVDVCEGYSIALSGSGADTYTWDNGVVDGVLFSPTMTNVYTVTGTDANGCQNTDDVTVTVLDCLGFNEGETTVFSVYPNPASDILTIERENPSEYSHIRIYDMAGKLVYDQIVTDNPLVINVNQWERGAYTISFTNDDDKMISGRIVLQ